MKVAVQSTSSVVECRCSDSLTLAASLGQASSVLTVSNEIGLEGWFPRVNVSGGCRFLG